MTILERANQLLSENKLKEAEFHFKSALEADPNQGEALFGLGRIAIRLEKYPQAVYLLQKACQRLPKVLDPLFALADAFDGLEKRSDAYEVLHYCTKIAPHNGESFYRLALHHLTYGYIKKAKQALLNGLGCPDHPVTPYIYYELSQLKGNNVTSKQIAHMHTLLSASRSTQAKVVLHYSLAKSYHNSGDKTQAFAHYRLANEMQYTLCTPLGEGFDQYINTLIAQFSTTFIAEQQDTLKASFIPVFIVGMPRTGSTLLEQMLCQHPSIASLGENDVISAKLMAYLSAVNEAPFPQCMANTNTDIRNRLRQMYVDELTKHQLAHRVVINKLPANFQALGAIQALMPNAVFIDLRRNFQPMAWSVFCHYFGANEPFFCHMDTLARYYEGYDNLMQHWRDTLGENLITIHYEQLVQEPEQYLRKIFSKLELSYTQQCLRYFESHHAVTTLSRHQVREPVYKDANKAYKEYEQAFSECFSRSVKTRPVHPETDPAALGDE
ncbi:tetratricopeptide repeat-containing sulfotransferase family protein [Pseudoalteromonas ruthenica]|uniref:tetratricopeptide repeat-containing sulfotransferase family protein n=1 Tax=Pseudoalteromonas ruthenica TaxID=151081 RepID=UPI00034600A4|nr:sulfotransferase [Pseudoalteromonas ruthenica]